MEAKGISQSEMARRVGVSQSTIWKLTQAGAQGSKHTHRIAAILGTSPEYLMDETEDPSPGVMNDGRLGWGAFPVEQQADPDLVEIAQIDMRYGLGGTYVDGPVSENPRRFSRAWLRQFTHASPEKLVWALGDGDSMEPTIRDGEVILIDRSRDHLNMRDGIWACTIGDVGMVKRLRPMPDGTVRIMSDNKCVPEDLAADSELHIVGRVVAVVRKL